VVGDEAAAKGYCDLVIFSKTDLVNRVSDSTTKELLPWLFFAMFFGFRCREGRK
jgi:hypothetical protein